MVSLEDLKNSLLNKPPNKFYVFYGEDSGLKKHYINKIAESFSYRRSVEFVSDIEQNGVGKGLFVTSNLFVVYNDIEFARSKKSDMDTFIGQLLTGTDCLILLYEEPLESSNLFKNYGDYITYFPRVKENIALEFIDSEITLSTESKLEMAFNCENDYGNILLESDKIKNYAQAKNVNEQIAYEDLRNAKQLLFNYPPYKPDDLMNDILQGNFSNLSYWVDAINNIYYEQFWIMLGSILNNYLIAYLIAKYGKWEGGQRAFDYGLPWYRIKQIRDFNIPYTADYLLDCANQVCEMDAMMKSGKITVEHLFDYFLTVIV